VETGYYDEVVNSIMEEIDQFTTEAYERIVYRYVIEKHLPLLKGRDIVIGRYVHRGIEIDLDILAKDTGKAIVYEIKWSDLSGRDVEKEYHRLLRKVEKTILREYNVEAYIVARRSPEKKYTITLKDIPI